MRNVGWFKYLLSSKTKDIICNGTQESLLSREKSMEGMERFLSEIHYFDEQKMIC